MFPGDVDETLLVPEPNQGHGYWLYPPDGRVFYAPRFLPVIAEKDESKVVSPESDLLLPPLQGEGV